MSEASELLDNITEGSVYLVRPGEESHVVIGPDRVITVPDELKRVAVQYDHDIETVTFDCPRYWDEHDFSKMVIYVKYEREDGYNDRFPAENIVVDDDDETLIHFDWTISRNVTKVNGQLQIQICVMKTDADGNEQNHWNSEMNTDMYVSEGMKCGHQEEVLVEPDIITSVLLNAESSNKAAEAAAKSEEIATDAAEAASASANTANAKAGEAIAAAEIAGNKANVATNAAEIAVNSANTSTNVTNALKGSVSGSPVVLDDVSPIEHLVDVEVRSENLISLEKLYSNKNITIEGNDADGIVSIIDTLGGSTVYYDVGNYADFVGKTLTLTVSLLDTTNSSGRTSFNTFIQADNSDFASVTTAKSKDGVITFTVPERDGAQRLMLRFYLGYMLTGAGDTATLVNLKLEEGPTATEYVPFADLSDATLTVYGADETDNPQSYTIGEGGKVEGIKSLYPTMQFSVDKDYAIIDVDYNRDINKAFAELLQMISK